MVGITDSGALENQRRAKSAARHDDLAASLVELRLLVRRQGLRGDSQDASSLVTLDDDLVGLGVANEVQVGVVGPGRVNVSMSRVGSTASVTKHH